MSDIHSSLDSLQNPLAMQDVPHGDKAGRDVRVKRTLSHEEFADRQGSEHFTKNQRVICSQASKLTGKCWPIRSGITLKVQVEGQYSLFLKIKIYKEKDCVKE